MIFRVLLIGLLTLQLTACFDNLVGFKLNRKLEQETTMEDIFIANMKKGNLKPQTLNIDIGLFNSSVI